MKSADAAAAGSSSRDQQQAFQETVVAAVVRDVTSVGQHDAAGARVCSRHTQYIVLEQAGDQIVGFWLKPPHAVTRLGKLPLL